MKKLTKNQQRTADFISRYIKEHLYSPTYKEIAEHFKVNVNAIQQTVAALVKKGALERNERIARGLRVKQVPNAELLHGSVKMITIPLYGNVAAGEPVFADNNIEGYITVDKPRRLSGEMFAVTVRGDSMTDKKIIERDKLIIRKQSTANDGEIVVALLDDEVTVKIFKKNNGKPYLQPANNKYDPIRRPFKILGIVVGLTRDYTEV
ncbi:MAG: transcriptional repressor LexA [Ignavibacteria bacterium]|nr:transcriptional repressor LexA [Ignavibacteria bacterium]